MAINPAVDVAAWLAGTRNFWSPPGGSTVLVLGANLFNGPMREADQTDGSVPARAVFCSNAGAMPAQAYLSYASHGTLKVAFVNIEVRSKLDDFVGGEALAHACNRRLMFADLTAAGYVKITTMSAQPDYWGSDERGLHMFTFMVEVTFREAPYAG